MTIDTAIHDLKEDYASDYNKQLVEWLEELKMLRELKNEHRKIGNIEGYNQALKDVYKKSFKEYDERVSNDLILSITEPVLKKLANKQRKE